MSELHLIYREDLPSIVLEYPTRNSITVRVDTLNIYTIDTYSEGYIKINDSLYTINPQTQSLKLVRRVGLIAVFRCRNDLSDDVCPSPQFEIDFPFGYQIGRLSVQEINAARNITRNVVVLASGQCIMSKGSLCNEIVQTWIDGQTDILDASDLGRVLCFLHLNGSLSVCELGVPRLNLLPRVPILQASCACKMVMVRLRGSEFTPLVVILYSNGSVVGVVGTDRVLDVGKGLRYKVLYQPVEECYPIEVLSSTEAHYCEVLMSNGDLVCLGEGGQMCVVETSVVTIGGEKLTSSGRSIKNARR